MNKQATSSQASEAPVWFITGCSTGFGLELAKQAIERGYRTVPAEGPVGHRTYAGGWRRQAGFHLLHGSFPHEH